MPHLRSVPVVRSPGRRGLAGLVVLALLVGVACAHPEDRTEVTSVLIRRVPTNALTLVARLQTDAPVRARLAATSPDHEVVMPMGEPATDQQLSLVGLRPETSYEVSIDAVDLDGRVVVAGEPRSVRSGPLPRDFPTISLEIDPERSEDGFTLLSMLAWDDPAPEPDAQATPIAAQVRPAGYLAIVDDEGEVVWYQPMPQGALDARQTDEGYLFTYDETEVREIDARGRTLLELAGRVATEISPVDFNGRARATPKATPMDTDSAHHDVGPLSNGNLLLLSTELQQLTGPPMCGEDAAEVTYPVISDVVVEVDPRTGEVVGRWPLSDIYDPFQRPGSELCTIGPVFAPPNFFYPVEGVRDWTHANSVVLDEKRNALIVSSRHLSAIIAIRYHDDFRGPAGELLWELGADGTLPLDGEPTSYQHAAEVLDDGNILVYDNGNQRPGASVLGGGAPPYSRAVLYEVDDGSDDPSRWSARQVWEYELEGADALPVFTAFLGDVDQLDEGNVLITHGAIADAAGRLSARVVEVEPDPIKGGQVVYDLRVSDESSGWTVYRSERIPSILPAG